MLLIKKYFFVLSMYMIVDFWLLLKEKLRL